MAKLKSILQSLPAWMLSGVCLLVVLYLTLTPKPLGENDFILFTNADKVVHGIMFGGLLVAICVDKWRQNTFNLPSIKFIVSAAFGVILLGGVIELLQMVMNIGRSADVWDFIADSIGVILMVIIYLSYRYDR